MSLFMVLILAAFILLLDATVSHSQVDEGQAEIICRVTDVDDSDMVISGVVMLGSQQLTGEIIGGRFDGQVIKFHNSLIGQYEYDQHYKVGDKVLVGARIENDVVTDAVAVDYVRQNYVIILFGVFAVMLLLYAGKIGLRAILSFAVSVLIIWYVLIPCLLSNYPAIPVTILTVLLLSAVIIFSVAGFSRKAFSAFFGSVSGIIIPVALAYIFGALMEVDGLAAPYAPTLMLRGYANLNMQDIFYCAILIGASGACMDIAMDVAASMEEVQIKKPDITRKELVKSGFNVGRSVIGTMATTLLLAYSGSYLMLMMLFKVSETSLVRLLNMKIFTIEVMRVLIGSMALLLVAPLTAFIAGYIFKASKKHRVVELPLVLNNAEAEVQENENAG